MSGLGVESLLKRRGDVVFRRVGGECLLVPIRRTATSLESIYTLNEVTAFVWEQIDGALSVGALVTLVVAEFEVGEVEAESDLLELLAELLSVGAVIEVL